MNKKQITHWLSVIVIGIALGFALQFVRAWTEPTTAPPGGNVGAPINTGANKQVKKGTATQNADICVDVAGNGIEKCLSTVASSSSSTTTTTTTGPAPTTQFYSCPNLSYGCYSSCVGQSQLGSTCSYTVPDYMCGEGVMCCGTSYTIDCAPI